MKTSFTSLAVFVAALLPASLLAQIEGLPVPASISLGHALGAFVVAFTLLIAFADYTRGARSSLTHPATRIDGSRPTGTAKFKWLATESRRLAA